MKKITLSDFEKWKNLNKGDDFSLFDYIFHITQKESISSDIFFAFLELIWPSFIFYENNYFLKSNFSKKKLDDLTSNQQNTEYWINLLMLDPYFTNTEEEKSLFFAKSLVEIWKIKLARDFPGKNFIVECVSDSECGDYGLTFYQDIRQQA